MRIYTDEDVSDVVVAALRGEHDVVRAVDVGGSRRTDAWQLRRAATDNRILLTVNHTDFRFLHRVWTSIRMFGAVTDSHAGIVTTTRRPDPTEWVRAIGRLFDSGRPLGGRLFVWHHVTNDWLQDQWRPEE